MLPISVRTEEADNDEYNAEDANGSRELGISEVCNVGCGESYKTIDDEIDTKLDDTVATWETKLLS